jgi:hypothetical protein
VSKDKGKGKDRKAKKAVKAGTGRKDLKNAAVAAARPVDDNGSAEIAKAEKQLAKALAKVEEARGELMARERELTDLMRRHGRLPDGEALDVDEPVADGSGNGIDIDAAGPREVRLFDQVQIVSGDQERR